jgi:hypothetical protein
MKSIVYLTHVIIGFSGVPVILYLYYLGGRAFIHTCSVISSTYSFIVYGDYSSQLSYLNTEYRMHETVNNLIWFPDLPLEGINKIGEYLQYSFFSRDGALNVFIYSLCALIISSIFGVIIEMHLNEKYYTITPIGSSYWYFIGAGISILCFYPAWLIVTFIPFFAFF